MQLIVQGRQLELTNRFSEDPCARNGPKSTAARVNKQLEVITGDVQLNVQPVSCPVLEDVQLDAVTNLENDITASNCT